MISVIIPIYNVEPYLKKCLNTVIGQSYHNLEIILIDDGSTDGSGKICDKYAAKDKRIKVIHKENEGVSIARNIGIRESKGDWLLFIDADDWIDLRLVETCEKYFDEKIDVCFFGHTRAIEDTKKNIWKSENLPKIQLLERTDFINFQNEIFNRDRKSSCNKKMIKAASPCKFYRRSIIESNNILFPEGIPNGEDGIFNLYVYRFARCGLSVNEILYYNRQRQESATHNYNPNIQEKLLLLHTAYSEFFNTETYENEFSELLMERYIWSLGYCCLLCFCHRDNTAEYRERRRQFLNATEGEYKNVIENVSLNNFGLQKKLLFYFIKKKNFLIVDLLCKLVQ